MRERGDVVNLGGSAREVVEGDCRFGIGST